MTDFKTARHNMVESQVRPSSVTDRRLIDAMATIPREAYLPMAHKALAYMDEDIALDTDDGGRRHLMQPMMFAKLAQLAEVGAEDLVLDVGSGLGYSSAILATLADSVVSLECDEGFAGQAIDTLTDQGIDNCAIVTGELLAGYADEGPYDVIFLNGAVSAVPEVLIEQLKPGGRLVAVVGVGPLGRAHLFVRHGEVVAEKIAFDATIPPLPESAPAEPAFVF